MKTEQQEVITKELRARLKQLLAKELEQLPEYLEGLEPKQRVEYLIKLLPFVFPKVESVRYNIGEPDRFDSWD